MSSYDRYKRKRKRTAPVEEVGPKLRLESVKNVPSHDEIPEDEKVANYLNKLRKDVNSSTFLKLVVSSSEAEYFDAERVQYIKETFKIHDITVSPPVAGSIDRFISLVGTAQEIVRGALFVAFILNAKLNNFAKNQLYTLKSNNYRLSLLVPPSIPPAKAPSSVTTSITSSHHRNESEVLSLHAISGDFTGCFHALMGLAEVMAKANYLEDAKITHLRLFGNTTDPNFFQRSETKESVLVKNKSRLLEFVGEAR
ncbi:uncharacterized protein CANTADRAFT_5673 [Suhomyces tanzawaensis NRRL Y-17324]|uniref:Uncharacterized protein n=1 Tax=Suhomyces tanzawaensis NRRL Y-17324 TaxID=984487 RepID=A0A1E4SKG3_9ASCO|nr:uncharacterized protein CANTADRAFT_5673 [Suhomyces tanzawaensis NRRL Y-17324]ODV79994.1 hypothetical protein CANTADRAFT_5673 [Suhomyces tanzawaensis NRRL Y-17324]